MPCKPAVPSLLALLISLQPAAASAAASAYWMPISDGTTWTFLESGSFQDSAGNSGSHGPVRLEISFSSIDYQIIDHRASLRGNTGWYLMETANGYYRVADKGDPNLNQQYRYYTDPQPFMTRDLLEVGQDFQARGTWRGQSTTPRGGFEAWIGTWEILRTNLGIESVNTPLGTFDAIKFREVSSSTSRTPATRPLSMGRASWTEYVWLVENLSIVKVMGSGINESDYNGDGIVDRWVYEELTYLATPVPEPASAGMLGLGTLILLGFAITRRASRPGLSARPGPQPLSTKAHHAKS